MTGIVNALAAVRRAIMWIATTAMTVVVGQIVATIFATAESASTVTADRFNATFAKVMAVGGRVSQAQSGAKIGQMTDVKM